MPGAPRPGRIRAIAYDAVFWLSLALKLALTAGIVVSASVVVERAGPLIGALVCALMGSVLGLSYWAGPAATGMLAVYPISTTSTMLVLHARIGGRASAAVVANGLWGMLGIALGLFALSQTILPLGAPAALALALVLPMGWNLSVWVARRRGARRPG